MNERPTFSPKYQLSPIEVAAAVEALTWMFLTFRQQSDNAAGLAQAYLGGMADLPLWAVEKACRRFAQGHVPDRKTDAFAPSLAELHIEAAQQVEDQERFDRGFRPALPAPLVKEVSAEVRARTKLKIEALVAELKAGEKETIDEEKAIHRKAIAEMAEWDRKKIIA